MVDRLVSSASLGPQGRTFFGVVTMYDVDVESLHGGSWVRTNIIAYVCAQLQERVLMARDDAPAALSELLIIDPSVAQAIYFFNDASVGPRESMRSAAVWLVPVNDYSVSSLNGGSHWSLLRVAWNEGEATVAFTHFDSYGSLNLMHASHLADILLRTFFKSGGKGALPSAVSYNGLALSPKKERDAASYPQQPNSCDCGLYLCHGMRAHADLLCERGKKQFLDVVMRGEVAVPLLRPEQCAIMRAALVKEITHSLTQPRTAVMGTLVVPGQTA